MRPRERSPAGGRRRSYFVAGRCGLPGFRPLNDFAWREIKLVPLQWSVRSLRIVHTARLFNHLVGAGEQRWRHIERTS